jgi:hypothetical protein
LYVLALLLIIRNVYFVNLVLLIKFVIVINAELPHLLIRIDIAATVLEQSRPEEKTLRLKDQTLLMQLPIAPAISGTAVIVLSLRGTKQSHDNRSNTKHEIISRQHKQSSFPYNGKRSPEAFRECHAVTEGLHATQAPISRD